MPRDVFADVSSDTSRADERKRLLVICRFDVNEKVWIPKATGKRGRGEHAWNKTTLLKKNYEAMEESSQEESTTTDHERQSQADVALILKWLMSLRFREKNKKLFLMIF
jgi:hypothetical protein